MYNAVVLMPEDTLEEIKKEAKLDSFLCFVSGKQTFDSILKKMEQSNEMGNFICGSKNYGVNSIYGKNAILV